MATKPSTLPRPWATNPVYLTGPFAGDPGKVDPGAGVAAEGHRPGAANPTAAEHENYQQNLVTASWIPWVNSGSSAGAADAHIVETTSGGLTTLQGLTVNYATDATAVNITGVNTIAPTVQMTSTGGGQICQANLSTSSGGGFAVSMTGAVARNGFTGTATATSSGNICDFTIPSGSSSNGIVLRHDAVATRAISILANVINGIEAMSIVTTRGIALRLTDNGALGCPLVITPRGPGPTTPGSLFVSTTTNNLTHVDNSSVTRNNWNSVTGLSVASQQTTLNFSVAANNLGSTSPVSQNYAFVAGQRYWIEISMELGRFTGSTRNVTVSANVGGVALSWSPFTVELFQAGGAIQLERLFHRRVMFTAGVSGTLAVTANANISGGAGGYNYGSAILNIEGHYD